MGGWWVGVNDARRPARPARGTADACDCHHCHCNNEMDDATSLFHSKVECCSPESSCEHMLKRKLQLHFITRRLEMFATSYYEARLLLRNKP